MRMFVWRHSQSECVFIQFGQKVYGAKPGEMDWRPLTEEVFPVVFLDGIEYGRALVGNMPYPIEVRFMFGVAA